MLTLDFILNNTDLVVNSFRKRGFEEFSLEKIQELNEKRKESIQKTQELQEEKNKNAKEIGRAKSQGLDARDILKRSNEIKETLQELEKQTREINEKVKNYLLGLPNVLDESVPEGVDENDNVEIKKWGQIKKQNFEVKEHYELFPNLLDFETAAKISGARFSLLRGKMARLERALINFMLDSNREQNYEEVSPPILTNPEAFVGTGQLPKFDGDFFKTTDGRYLIPTAEVALTNIVANSILNEKELPLRMTTVTPCFRSEAGSAGRDTRGIIRQHQFYKVELVTIAKPDESANEHEYMLNTAEKILQKLNLPYRVVNLCSGDIGATARKTYDIEVYLPGQKKYREISSISNTHDYQARRMMARFKDASKITHYLHSLNGSSLAVGRTIVAILENYQQEDGSVKIPEALIPYCGFDIIEK